MGYEFHFQWDKVYICLACSFIIIISVERYPLLYNDFTVKFTVQTAPVPTAIRIHRVPEPQPGRKDGPPMESLSHSEVDGESYVKSFQRDYITNDEISARTKVTDMARLTQVAVSGAHRSQNRSQCDQKVPKTQCRL